MIKTGLIVKSTAGHDKNQFFCVVAARPGGVFVANGKERKLNKPKLKNEKHVAPTNTVLDPGAFSTDKQLRRALGDFSAGRHEQGGIHYVQDRRHRGGGQGS